MGDTAPTAETTQPTDEARSSEPDSADASGPVDPAEIRYRPGVRREGTFKIQYVTIHGYRRAYVKAGAGPALLLIHGIGDSSDTWRPVVEELAAHYTVIAPDLLGHGRSEKPRADYSVAGFANGMRDLLSVLEVDRATVVGHSLGGGVAAQFAYQFPDRCERLVLVSSGGVGRTVSPLLRMAAVPGIELLMPFLGLAPIRSASRLGAELLRLFDTALGRDAEEILAVFDALPDTEARMGILRTLRSSVDWNGQVITMVDRAYLAEGIPTLVVWGRRDAIIPLGHGRLIHTVMPGSGFEIFDEAGHFPHHTDPARFVRVLREFMERSMPASYDQSTWRDRLLRGARTPAPVRQPPKGAAQDASPSAVPAEPLGRVPVVDGEDEEVVLQGGVANRGLVVRVGPHVLRPSNPHSQSVFAFLRHVRHAGFEGVPQPLGIDADGRERLEFIQGDAPAAPYPEWALADGALASIAALIARFHGAAAGFDGSGPGLNWNEELADAQGGPIVCHNDICLENVVFRGGEAVGLLDFDFSAPGRPVSDLAQFARMCVPIDDEQSAALLGWDGPDKPSRLRLVCDSYGLDRSGREDLLEILDDAMAHSGEFVKRHAELGEPGFVMMWEWMGGQERWDRRRRWWAEDRPTFVGALA
jgi:pimeloyl-ACP methyl ester carboxylesterase